MTIYACLDCREPAPTTADHLCKVCGGMLGIPDGISFERGKIAENAPGIWRFRESFGLPEHAPILTLGEGDTPLVPVEVSGRELFLKLESSNPSGSYKDRLASVLVSSLAAKGVQTAVEDSSGNAGAAFAAYAGCAGIRAKVFVPAYASGPKRQQIESYGAEVVPVPGPRQAASDAVMRAVEQGEVYASHALLPQGLTGLATIAYELVENLGTAPRVVITPAGNGGMLLGVIMGFQALMAAGEIEALPSFFGVQARENAPLWAAANGLNYIPGSTIAEGIAVSQPSHLRELLQLHQSGILQFLVVEEDQIQQGREALSRRGFYVEPTSAVIWDAFMQVREELDFPVVAVISGHGLKA